MRPIAIVGAGVVTVCAAVWLEGYFALFAWLVASGFGVPPGEDLLVASAGALVAKGDLMGWVATPVAIVAVVTSDALLFSCGQGARSAIVQRASRFSKRSARRIEALVIRRETLAIAIARFVPGIRALVFVSVGARGLSRGRFLLIDTCAAAAWVPLVMTCGAAIIALILGEDWSSLKAWI